MPRTPHRTARRPLRKALVALFAALAPLLAATFFTAPAASAAPPPEPSSLAVAAPDAGGRCGRT
ncbi:hypothetical protein [Streptomyces neyagawaensis]|uniref:Uncharacterized protein n=1 Tax=Streptomyces neyagawaensis TaxID=42238 RepID=A0ABV3BD78_9ACTN